MVYLNTIKIPVRAATAGGLTLEDVDDIRTHGPYTRLFCTMKPLLEPSKVEADMDKWFLQSMRYVKQATLTVQPIIPIYALLLRTHSYLDQVNPINRRQCTGPRPPMHVS